MNKNNLNINLAVEEDIPLILNLLKERCKWFRDNKIDQWGDWYYTEKYNQDYFLKAMHQYKLYVVKEDKKLIGAFLLKSIDPKYWHDNIESYYIHHFVGKVGYHEIGAYMLEFIENLARDNKISTLRLDCIKINPKINEYWKNCGFENRGEFEKPYEGVLWEKRIELNG